MITCMSARGVTLAVLARGDFVHSAGVGARHSIVSTISRVKQHRIHDKLVSGPAKHERSLT